jgi:hypothetical protein
VDPTIVSDQRFVSPPITLPTGQLPLTLQFWNYQDIEEQAGQPNCWDAGILEISTNGGSSWTQMQDPVLLTDPYFGPINASANPLGGARGWCNLQDWTRSIVDLNAFEGQTVQFRFRLGSDASVGTEGWYLDDVKVQSCSLTPPDLMLSDGFEN